MQTKKTVSLVIIDTDSYQLAKRAIEKSIVNFSVDEVIIFSDNQDIWGKYKCNKVGKIRSSADYNEILLMQLPHYLKTDFALVIQYDGFIINPSSFSDFFFKFDYIGAPWPAGTIGSNGAMVGNGGFSLRSKRLVNAIFKYRAAIDINISEDMMISRLIRPMLEEMENISFAPVEVARYFSVEFERNQYERPFGFHGLHLLPIVYKDDINFLLDNLPERCLIEGSYQLNNLRTGFSHLSNDAKILLEKKVLLQKSGGH